MMVLYMLTSETNVYACIDVFPQAASEISRMPSAKENGCPLHMYETLIPTQLKAQQTIPTILLRVMGLFT